MNSYVAWSEYYKPNPNTPVGFRPNLTEEELRELAVTLDRLLENDSKEAMRVFSEFVGRQEVRGKYTAVRWLRNCSQDLPKVAEFVTMHYP